MPPKRRTGESSRKEDPEAVVDWALQAAANDSDEVEGEEIVGHSVVLHPPMTRDTASEALSSLPLITTAMTATAAAPRSSPRTRMNRAAPINVFIYLEDMKIGQWCQKATPCNFM